jgi:hypothetical protein
VSGPIERLEAELARLGGEHEPKPGWQARVLAATAKAKPARHPWWQFAIPALVVAVAVVAIVIKTRGPDELALAIDIDGGSAVVRGHTAKPDDLVTATATGGNHRAVWIFRGEELVMACPGAAKGCTETSTSITARTTLQTPGNYIVVALESDAPLAVPTGKYDGEIARATRSGARMHADKIEVR